MKRDPTRGSKDHAHNKKCFREYIAIELLPSGRIAIAMKEAKYTGKTPQHAATTQLAVTTQHFAATQHATTSSLRSLLVRKCLTRRAWPRLEKGWFPSSKPNHLDSNYVDKKQ